MFEMKRNKPVVCADGFRMSVQAGEDLYCTPRIDNAVRYQSVEVGFPSSKEELLIDYAEPITGTVYPYVPVSVVSLVIAKHGGMVEGEVPPGVPELRAVS